TAHSSRFRARSSAANIRRTSMSKVGSTTSLRRAGEVVDQTFDIDVRRMFAALDRALNLLECAVAHREAEDGVSRRDEIELGALRGSDDLSRWRASRRLLRHHRVFEFGRG